MTQLLKDMKELKKDNNSQKGHGIGGNDDAYFLFIGQKIEKLSNALYVITKGFPDQDGIKWTLRERALRTMSFMSEIKDASVFSREHVLGRIAVELRSIVGLVTLSRNAGYLSDMNAHILVEEYERLLGLCQTAESGWVQNAVSVSEAYLPHPSGGAPGLIPSTLKSRPGSISNSSRKSPSGAAESTRANPSSEGRREQILKLMEAGREYSIKEVFEQVPGVSEKTIQRELLAMVELGILVKKGERRWSTYSKA